MVGREEGCGPHAENIDKELMQLFETPDRMERKRQKNG
jgi:hypothetical protein